MNTELIEMLREQREFEKETIDLLTPMVDATKNSIIKLFLNRLVLDSMKHVDILQAAIDLNTGAVVSDVDKKRMNEELERHIKNEAEMLYRIQTIMSEVEDDKTKSLLKEIVLDEKRHHEILKELMKIIERIENVSDEEWWDLIYDRSEWLF